MIIHIPKHVMNQKPILLSLALNTAFLSTFVIINCSFYFENYARNQYILSITFLMSSLYHYSLLLFITFDRFLQVYMHLRYQSSKFNRHKTTICYFLFTLYVVATTSMLLIIGKRYRQNIWIRIVYMSFDAVIIIESVFVYTYLILKIKSSNRKVRCSTQKKYQLSIWFPLLIVLSFVLFYAVPSSIYFIQNYRFLPYASIIYNFYPLADFFVYTYFQKPIRKFMWKTWRNWIANIENSNKLFPMRRQIRNSIKQEDVYVLQVQGTLDNNTTL